ncbi:hypothetical protein ACCAA_1350001 [Candidatus Accumulibacter aalborgensis]|uniref:RHS repeat-associated core domain-containing protein n=1 Tax=Candidatus Accumulibacter aalborgensis TaxID=1860102 RepID=A0A1A8XJ44_9PROT|nr:hypothetical protein ACCAA_1350001 [Candidatus Accumulibacter aalborgensis]
MLIARPAGSHAALTGADSANPTFSADLPGQYLVQLIVNDGQLASTPNTVSISVTNTPPTVSLSAPAAKQSFTAPATITVSAEAADTTGKITEVAFYQGSTPIGSATSAPYRITWSNVPVGNYVLKARATDSGGATTWSAEVPITVAAGGVKIYYLHHDHLNTPRLVTDETNKVVWRNTPLGEPFGMGLPEEDPDGDGQAFTLNLRFPGQYADRESSLNYNYFRDSYFPDLGRYGQSDPIGINGGANTYSYVGGNPLLFSDPSGLCPLCPLLALGLVATEVATSDVPMIGGGIVRASAKAVQAVEQCAAKAATTVIGRVKDLRSLQAGEQSLLDRLPNLGNPKANWAQNSGVLRQEIGRGLPIRDASPLDTTGQFLNAERNLLIDRGWTFDRATNYWVPPKP